MDFIIRAINDHYNDRGKEDLTKSLNWVSKDDLIEFIIEMQARGCFGRGIIHD